MVTGFKNHGSRNIFQRNSWVSQSSQTCLAFSIFFTAKKAAKYRFLYILSMNLNNVETSQAHIENTLKSRSRKSRSQNVSGLQRKTLVSPSCEVSHSPPIFYSIYLICIYSIINYKLKISVMIDEGARL